jgi:hypothetical protein
LLFTKFRAKFIWNKLDESVQNPSSKSTGNSNNPMLPRQSSFRNFHHYLGEFHYENLNNDDDKPHTNKHFVFVESFKYIPFVIDLSHCNHVKYLEDHKYIENVCHMPTGPIHLLLQHVKWCVIPIVESSWVQEISLSSSFESPLRIWFWEEIFSCKDNSINNHNLIK